jgi:RNA polymerase sigma-70 factor (ECF subfamily)
MPKTSIPVYYVLLGELYKDVDSEKAKINFQKAHALAKTQAEKQGIQTKIAGLSNIQARN